MNPLNLEAFSPSENTLQTNRLILRPWIDSDLVPFANLNADPRVMKYFTFTVSQEESDQFAALIREHFRLRGWGLWAVSIPNIADFIGFIGLRYINFAAPFTPAVEIGWRLAYDYWNKGYATEGAKAALNYGFNTLKLEEIIASTTFDNQRSRRVMEKIGMTYHSQDDFKHPNAPLNHPFSQQVLYRIQNA